MGAVWPGEAGGTVPEHLRREDGPVTSWRGTSTRTAQIPTLETARFVAFFSTQETHNPHPTNSDLDPTSVGKDTLASDRSARAQTTSVHSEPGWPWRSWGAAEATPPTPGAGGDTGSGTAPVTSPYAAQH